MSDISTGSEPKWLDATREFEEFRTKNKRDTSLLRYLRCLCGKHDYIVKGSDRAMQITCVHCDFVAIPKHHMMF